MMRDLMLSLAKGPTTHLVLGAWTVVPSVWWVPVSLPLESTCPLTSTRTPGSSGNMSVGVRVTISVAKDTFTDMVVPVRAGTAY